MSNEIPLAAEIELPAESSRKKHSERYTLFKGLSSVVALFMVMAILQADASAQKPKPKKLAPELEGTIHAIVPQRKLLQVVTNDNKPWQIEINKKTSFKILGEGTTNLLRPGMVVQFHAKLSKKGLGVEPIHKIQVVTPDEGFTFGAVEDPDGDLSKPAPKQEAKKGKKKKDKKETETKSDKDSSTESSEAEEATEDSTPEKTKRKKQSFTRKIKPRIIPSKIYWVSGIYRGMQKDKMIVTAGKARIRVEVAEGALVTINATDPRYARAKDKVIVRGSYYTLGSAVASVVTVTIQPPAEPAEKPNRRRKKPSKKRVKTEAPLPSGSGKKSE